MDRFVADYRRRERDRLPSPALIRSDGTPALVTAGTRADVLDALRRLLTNAWNQGRLEQIRLDREFAVAVPATGARGGRVRRPFPDHVAKAVADPANLDRLDALDTDDRGLRDVWETLVATGRRCGEVIGLKLECVEVHHGLPLLWHDQTKIGHYDEAIRIPQSVHARLEERRRKTLAAFVQRHGRHPSVDERAGLALFPTPIRNPFGTKPLDYSWFYRAFRIWMDGLHLGGFVAHQARHTLATALLRHGAGLSHIRRYLGHVSERMTERYAKIALSEIEDVLQHVWVTGPGSPIPGQALSTGIEPMDRARAEALAVDLARRSTPAEGGFCTFQPVVQGHRCPWNLDCHNCDKFVLSGADLLYWRRKREQWRAIAERAPDDATADYLHQVFAPTGRAIDGLEKALAALGLLDDALSLDMRRPQDFFNRVWSTSFPAADLATDHDNSQKVPE
ncbi:site-specific integrase [Saccharothrix syringae]|uniref:Site-specific integrase n=2 Tax=Saccharothrix syringae TaxID=103733 RepID=A0A5Q0HDU9_SACSY|nr:site-specific integrase [Saccharothrix syringae]